MKKKVFIIGNNANAYALAKKFSKTADVFITPGSDSLKEFATCLDIRENNVIKDNTRIGSFVEVKNSVIDDDTRVSHLSYIGDSTLGKNINIGCGVVTANYDGKNKYQTRIDDDAFIGCNTNLIAPINIGKKAYIAAGSTITKDVLDNEFAIARSVQENKMRRD